MWRVSAGCLPTKDQLRIKKADVNALYPNCDSAPETIIHALVTCSFAQACWNRIGMTVAAFEHIAFTVWLSIVIEQYKGDEVQRKVMLYLGSVDTRNKLV